MTPAMRAWREAHPRSRRTRPTAIVHSGGVRTVYDCLCGARHSVATRNRGQTRHERDWLQKHEGCGEAWFEAQGRAQRRAERSRRGTSPHGRCDTLAVCVEHAADKSVPSCKGRKTL